MTNKEKSKLRQLAKAGYSFGEIQSEIKCSDATIKRYIEIFSPKKEEKDE